MFAGKKKGMQETNQTRRELRFMWDYFRCVCLFSGGKRYEAVPFEEKWRDFDSFVKDNWIRYLRAKVKWKGYKRVIFRNDREVNRPLKLNNVRFKRKVKELGYTKENTVFTSPSDAMKYIEVNHRYMFEGKLLGTRDIKNILKKRGINLTMVTIVNRLNKGFDLFATKERESIKWKGKWRSYVEIAEMESVSLGLLKHRNYKVNNIKKALDYCRQWDGFAEYEFEGKSLRKFEICEILSERTGIRLGTMLGRFTKFGYDLKQLTAKKGEKFSLRKKIYSIKDGIETEYHSIEDASRKLKIGNGNISQAVNGKMVHCHGYKFRYENGQYNTLPIKSEKEKMDEIRGIAKLNSTLRHSKETRHCEVCDQTKDKKEFNPRNFRRCKGCISQDKKVKYVGGDELYDLKETLNHLKKVIREREPS